jgi:hypothetical protein
MLTKEMADRKWFLLSEGQVTGPYSKEDVESRLTLASSPLIWGRGQNEWVPADRWNQVLRDLDSADRKARSGPDRTWKIRSGGQELKPMTHDQMIDYLKTQKDYAEIQIWTEGYTDWKDIYQIHKIMDELGVSRRQHPRVPIMGTLTCEGATGNYTARVLSISEGGLGITEAPSVKIGEKFKTVLKSPNLYAPINSTAEVVYVGTEGYAGLKFVSLHPESKSAIIEYVKKFTDLRKDATQT